MNKWQAILSVFLEQPNAKLATFQIASRAQITSRDCSRSLSQMVERERVSRVRVDGLVGYRYFLNPDQVQRCVAPPIARVTLGSIASVIPGRIAFLQRLKELPAFEGMKMVDDMLADYKHALVVARVN